METLGLVIVLAVFAGFIGWKIYEARKTRAAGSGGGRDTGEGPVVNK